MRRYLTTTAVLVAVLAYALVRYVAFKGVPLAHVPLYVVNKAVAVLALVLIGLALWTKGSDRRWFAWAGLQAAGLHVLFTLPLLQPSYLPALYASPQGSGFSGAGEATLLIGALALFLMVRLGFVSAAAPLRRTATTLLVAGMVGLHCGLLGWASWWKPETWPGHLPPITLLGAVFALVAVIGGVLRGRE